MEISCIFLCINSELSQNPTEKQIIPFKTTVTWLFNDIWCYLVIGCFDWKIGVFQQTIKRGLLYPQSRCQILMIDKIRFQKRTDFDCSWRFPFSFSRRKISRRFCVSWERNGNKFVALL